MGNHFTGEKHTIVFSAATNENEETFTQVVVITLVIGTGLRVACNTVAASDEEALAQVDAVENYLIHTYGHQMNTKVEVPVQELSIQHLGDVPASISNLGKL